MKINHYKANSPKFSLPKADTYLAELFYENIKIRRKNALNIKEEKDDFVKNLLVHQQYKFSSFLTKQICSTPKDFGIMPKHQLPKRVSKRAYNLVHVLNNRRSIREFSSKNISLVELSTLLHAYKACREKDKVLDIKLRNIPSAGALYPLELYFTLLRSIPPALDAGKYHYQPDGHYVTCLTKKTQIDQIENFLSQPEIMVRKSAVIFYITGRLDKIGWKYSNRGFCYMLIEVGHLAQNLCLLATSMNLGICPIGGFIDDEANKYLNLGDEEKTLYILVVGHIKPKYRREIG